MAYDKKKVFEQAKKAIVKNNLFFADEIPAFLPCSRSTFYAFFPNDSDELDELKGMMEDNKINVKIKMRRNWQEAEAPALQLALMKLASTPEELRKLSMSYQESNVNQQSTVKLIGVDQAFIDEHLSDE